MNKQKGSAHIAIIIGLVILLIGAVGFNFWQNYVNKNTATNNEQQIGTKNDDTKKQDDALETVSSDPQARLQTIYSRYLNDTSSYRGDSGLAQLKADGYVAQDYSYDSGGEPLLCGQEAYPESVKITLTTKDANLAKLVVVKIYKDGSAASNRINAEMTLNKSSEWQLQKTNCITN